ncbi:MAG: Fur family transcriptional regulator, partial [Lachnospiraceae bacterium]|nr:Fur family transcriptional regulator [Lachnospiraceae bacterium]
ASLLDKKIGFATVYRMVNTLEEIGAISRKNMYRIMDASLESAYTVELDDDTVLELSEISWRQIIETGLEQCGYMNGRTVRSIMAR